MLSQPLLPVKTTGAPREITAVWSDCTVGSGVHLHVAFCREPPIAAGVRTDVVFLPCLYSMKDLHESLSASSGCTSG